MSKISDIHQHYLDRLAAVLPDGYARLSNPYKPEESANLLLKQGYGVLIGQSTTASQSIQPKVLHRRTMSIVLTREYLALHNDAASKALVEKQLVEDAALIQIDLQKDSQLSGLALRSSWLGDDGIEYVSQETERFLKIKIDFLVEYFEEAS